ncbi:MAG: hypothetical protein COS99_00285 [Candidatus Omnitrophica bacterium CG07_land_8_20_14_0_80_42_15]|uniref:histidine kinase n=1 Tax=Candidatus Aquitaenariimonas noxiae TaxID=1974741 RepID=A0A2J0L2W5_9BACT|nr:MAG: hypothetical protein COS99_00285 [Candidatus Omnitrophica bacterium CG07_land_8_20_14_0_80_42_15]
MKKKKTKKSIKRPVRQTRSHSQANIVQGQKEEDFKNVLQSLPDNIGLVDKDLNIIWANESVKKMFGSDIIGKKCYEVFYNRKKPCEPYPCIGVESFRDSNVHKQNISTADKNGKTIHFYCITDVALKDEKNHPSAIIEISRDVTHFKKLEEDLRKSEEKCSALIRSMPRVMCTSDTKGNVVSVTPNVEKVCGYNPEEIYKGGAGLWFGRIHPDDLKKVKESYDALFEKDIQLDIEYRIKRKDGEWIWIHDRSIYTYKKDDTMYADRGFSDITKRKKTEEELAVYQDDIRSYYRKILIMQEEEKRRMSRDLHDETGQVVIALGASLNIIEKAVKEGNSKKALALIDGNREILQTIASKMKSMALNLRPPELDILGLSAVLREYFSQCTTSNPIKIEFNENIKDRKLDSNVEITLYRIVQETIHNILKHSMAKDVKVNLIFSERNLQLIIEDNGIGFNMEEYSKQYDITKMGLRGIKERLDILNGTFAVESEPNKGTKIKIVLPMEEVKYVDRSDAR